MKALNMLTPHLSSRLAGIAMITLLVTAATAPLTQASTTILFDTFAGTNNTLNAGRVPTTINLPGNSYQLTGGFYNDPLLQSNTLKLNAVSGSAMNISSALGYTKPATMTLSADIQVGSLQNGADPGGLGLGFWSALHPNGNSYADSYGLLLRSNGSLSLVGGTTIYETVAWSGSTFDPNSLYNLSYSVDTATGNISAVSLAGSTADYSAINNDTNHLFTNANTTYAGLRGESGSSFDSGFADNFLISTTEAVPEPSRALLLCGGLMGVLLRRRRTSKEAQR